MQNRSEFLATSLVPVTNTSELPNDGCSVCTDPFQDPISLPCKHTFCKQCVVDWLNLPNRNTCPYCRHQCFTLTIRGPAGRESVPRQQLDSARTAIISQALTLSGLMNGEFSTFNDDISWHTASIQRATASANHWLNEQRVVVAPAIINKRRLGPDIIAMGNLLRGYARASGRPWSAQEVGEWRIIIDILYREIAARSMSRESAMILNWQLTSHVRTRLPEALSRTSTFIAEAREVESPAGDLARLIAYVTSRAADESTRRQEPRREIREEPRLIARMGLRLQNVFRN